MKTADTRGALLDAAEELFAERGVYGVSLGEVGRRANQHNRSTIQYHFGTREALIDAVAERHIAALNERRADLLRTLDLTSRGDDVRSLVETLVLPPFRLLGSSGFYFRFLVQRSLRASPARGFDELVQHPDSLAFGEVMQRLDAALAGVDPLVRIFRYRSAFLTLVQALAECEAAIGRGEELDEPFTITVLVDLVVGMLLAPDHSDGDRHLSAD
jgi:AcrR family transcriptional regulator